MKRLPWFPFYADDWLNDENVRIADIATRGVYICLLCHQWREGSIPPDVDSVMRLVGAVGSADDLLDERYAVAAAMAFFEPNGDGRLVNKRLAEIAKEQDELRAARSEAGRSGAETTNSRRSANNRQSRGKAEVLLSAKSGYSESESESESESDPYPAQPADARAREEPPARPSASPTVSDPTPITTQLATAAEIERCLVRYNALKPDLADDEDLAIIRDAMTAITTDPVTHKPFPPPRRLKILREFDRFDPEVVARAAHRYREAKGAENGKGYAYFLKICEGGATSETIEARAKREKEARGEDTKRTRKDDGTFGAAPRPIRDTIAALAARGVPRGDAPTGD